MGRIAKKSGKMPNSTTAEKLIAPFQYSPTLYCVVTNSRGHCLAANELFKQKVNQPFNASILLANTVSPANAAQFQEILNQALHPLSNIITAEIKHSFHLTDSTTIYWELSLHNLEEVQPYFLWIGMVKSKENDLFFKNENAAERYRAFENSAEGLWRIDFTKPLSIDKSFEEMLEHCKQHSFLAECNDNMARMYGFTKKEEIIGATMLQLMDLADPARVAALKFFVENGYHASNIETKEYSKTGEVLYFINNMDGIIEDGMLLRIWGTQQDITDKKNAETKIKESELFYRTLIADSVDGILLTNEEGVIQFSSASVTKILGYEAAYLIEKNMFDFVHPEDVALAVAAFQDEINKTPQNRFIYIRLLQKTGEWLWCMVRGHNQFSNTQINGILIYFSDDTMRRNTEAELLESREQFKQLIQNLNLGVLLCSPEGEIIVCNKACLLIFGVTQEYIIGKNVFNPDRSVIDSEGKVVTFDVYPISIAMKTKKPVRNAVIGLKTIAHEKVVWLEINAQPVLNADESIMHIICSFADITDQRSMTQQLKEQEMQKQRQLLQATIDGQEKERKEISQELHDNISQYLTTTRLYLEVAKGKAKGQSLEMIQLAHKGVLDIINEIRGLSQSLAPPELVNIGLVESVKDICNPLKKIHAFKIEFIHSQFSEQILPDNMKLMLFRIIQEQINNIIRHAAASSVRIELENMKGQLRLEITDDGKGFDPLQVKRGLGLTNMANRASLFDGQANIISSPGHGCMLQVVAPI
jgi:PAS domain S-box-containing protein